MSLTSINNALFDFHRSVCGSYSALGDLPGEAILVDTRAAPADSLSAKTTRWLVEEAVTSHSLAYPRVMMILDLRTGHPALLPLCKNLLTFRWPQVHGFSHLSWFKAYLSLMFPTLIRCFCVAPRNTCFGYYALRESPCEFKWHAYRQDKIV